MNENLDINKQGVPERKRKFNIKVLLAEDNLTLRLLAVEVLKSFGCSVEAVDNGQKLLDQLVANPEEFNLVITDLQMPGDIDGMKVLEEIKANFNNLPRILCSASIDDEIEQKVHELGGKCLRKPFGLNELEQIIKEMIPEKENKENTEEKVEKPE